MRFFIRCIGLLAVIILANCTKKTRISVRILEPGGITVPAHVKTIALINRSLPPNQANYQTSFATEGTIRDPRASHQVILGLANSLTTASPRYQVKVTNVELPGSPIEGNLPEPMDTGTIGKICRDFNADAVVSLEDFGANANSSTSLRPTQQIMPNGMMATVMQYVATQTGYVKVGFRIYDRVTNSIDDQYFFPTSHWWTTSPYGSEGQAMSNITTITDAINQTAYFAGQGYARRIAPVWSSEWRTFYKRSKNAQMGIASRMAMAGDWKGAMDLWTNNINKLNRAKAGRAAFNLALGYEVMGDLDQAQQWCEKSYAVYRNKQAGYYAQLLKQRVLNMQKVQQQLQPTDVQQQSQQ